MTSQDSSPALKVRNESRELAARAHRKNEEKFLASLEMTGEEGEKSGDGGWKPALRKGTGL